MVRPLKIHRNTLGIRSTSTLRIHQCFSFPWFSTCFYELLTCCSAIMVLLLPVFSLWVSQILVQTFWQLAQTLNVQITPWCFNFNTLHIEETFTICLKCARRPCFGPCFRKFGAPPSPSQRELSMTSALQKSRYSNMDYRDTTTLYIQWLADVQVIAKLWIIFIAIVSDSHYYWMLYQIMKYQNETDPPCIVFKLQWGRCPFSIHHHKNVPRGIGSSESFVIWS